MAEKKELAEVVAKCKLEYDQECRKKYFNSKTKKWQNIKPKDGYVARAFRQFYHNLKDKKWSEDTFRKAVSFASRSYEQFKTGATDSMELESTGEPSKKRFRAAGGGRKAQASNIYYVSSFK